jgi:hypothetical protein
MSLRTGTGCERFGCGASRVVADVRAGAAAADRPPDPSHDLVDEHGHGDEDEEGEQGLSSTRSLDRNAGGITA